MVHTGKGFPLFFSMLWLGGSISLCTETISFAYLTLLVITQICVMYVVNLELLYAPMK